MPKQPTAFGVLLRRLREEQRLSRRELSRLAELSPSLVFMVESGRVAYLGFPAVVRCAAVLDVPVEMFAQSVLDPESILNPAV